VYELPSGRFVVIWEHRRHFRTREEALEAAKSVTPTPRRGPPQVPDWIAQAALRGHEQVGMSWRAIADLFTAFAVPTPLGKTVWNGGTLRDAALRLKRQRDARDEEARRAEWHVEDAR
jgi:hypothetical protein